MMDEATPGAMMVETELLWNRMEARLQRMAATAGHLRACLGGAREPRPISPEPDAAPQRPTVTRSER